jgi:hypothetical protein
VDASLYTSQEILSDRGLDEMDVNGLGSVERTYANHESTVPKRRSSVSCARCTSGILSNIQRSFIAEKYVDRGSPVLFRHKTWMDVSLRNYIQIFNKPTDLEAVPFLL